MKIEIIKCLQDNYTYLIIDETNKNACVVDPGESGPIINFLKNKDINLRYILNTHHHHDHIGGNLELKKNMDLKLLHLKMITTVFQKLIFLFRIIKYGKQIILRQKFITRLVTQMDISHFIFLMRKKFLLAIHFFLSDVEEFLKELLSKCLIR